MRLQTITIKDTFLQWIIFEVCFLIHFPNQTIQSHKILLIISLIYNLLSSLKDFFSIKYVSKATGNHTNYLLVVFSQLLHEKKITFTNYNLQSIKTEKKLFQLKINHQTRNLIFHKKTRAYKNLFLDMFSLP